MDVVALTETHHYPTDDLPHIPGFQWFHVARPVSNTHIGGRHSGGIGILVSDTWAPHTTMWRQAADGSRLWLRIGDESDALYLCVVYAAPKGSCFQNTDLFQDVCQEVGDAMSLGRVLLAGDFNARTGNASDVVDCTMLEAVIPELQAIGDGPPTNLPRRQNRDAVRAGWWREVLDLCGTAGLCILNGRTLGDLAGEFTCLSNQSFSTVDYFLSSYDLLSSVEHLQIVTNEFYCSHKGADSDHRPLILRLTVDLPNRVASISSGVQQLFKNG